ncbi:hypothetical protein FACS189460_5260 [Deltaproteobacteria bacterium]|nr:hypothetical protein FACS189460_5260 [Deltaproteobacteria bacterium]
MTPADVANLTALLKAEEKAYAQGVWDVLTNEMFPLLDEMTRRTKGLPLEKVAAEPIMFGATEMRGGYYPLMFHREASQNSRVESAREKEAAILQAPGLFSPGQVQAKSTIHRVGRKYDGLVVDLSLGVLTTTLNEEIKDLAFREAANDVWRLIKRPEVKDAIERALGQSDWLQLKLWLRGCLEKDGELARNSAEKFWGKLRRNVTMMSLAGKMSVIALQASGITQSVEMLGARWTAAGVAAYYGKPGDWAGRKAQKRLFAKSVLLKMRNEQGYDLDIADWGKAGQDPLFKSAHQKFGDALFWPIKFLDQEVANCVWLGGYLRAVDQGKSETEAIDDADAVLSLTQPTGAAKDMSYAQRGGGHGNFGKMFTMFGTFFSGTQNLLWLSWRQAGREWRDGRQAQAAFVASRSAFLLAILPAIFTYLMRSADPWPDDEEEFDKMAAELGRGLAGNLTGGLPIVKDAINYGLSQALSDGRPRAFRMSPLEAAVEARGGAPGPPVAPQPVRLGGAGL